MNLYKGNQLEIMKDDLKTKVLLETKVTLLLQVHCFVFFSQLLLSTGWQKSCSCSDDSLRESEKLETI